MNLEGLITSLNERPWAAFLALSLGANLFLFRALQRSWAAHAEDLRELLPAAEQLTSTSAKLIELFERVGTRAAARERKRLAPVESAPHTPPEGIHS